MTYVFDSSFVGALIIPDGKNSRVDKIRASIDEDEEIFVPQLLWYEIANVFKNLIRRRRFNPDEVMQFFPFLEAIRLTVDYSTGSAYAEKLLRLCNDYNISSYDASYLELARRKNAGICTLDENLRSAAKKYGITVLA